MMIPECWIDDWGFKNVGFNEWGFWNVEIDDWAFWNVGVMSKNFKMFIQGIPECWFVEWWGLIVPLINGDSGMFVECLWSLKEEPLQHQLTCNSWTQELHPLFVGVRESSRSSRTYENQSKWFCTFVMSQIVSHWSTQLSVMMSQPAHKNKPRHESACCPDGFWIFVWIMSWMLHVEGGGAYDLNQSAGGALLHSNCCVTLKNV